MSRFVDECGREWKRLGVPEAVANEMAADLAADLAEAEAEGASPEDVLGNAVFDPRSFAASWATARGVVPVPQLRPVAPRRPRWKVPVSGAASFLALLAGLVLLGHSGSVSVAVAQRVGRSVLPFPSPLLGPRAFRIVPVLHDLPGGQLLVDHGGFPVIGALLVVAGLVGLMLTIWMWRPWSGGRRGPGFDENVGMPTFL